MVKFDVVVVGAGLSGLVAATEAAARGLKVCVVDQEGRQNLGGQAFWSLGGLFFIDSSEQRRMRIKDSFDLASQDWFGAARFDRPEDHFPRLWADAYLDFASGEKRQWLHQMGMRWFPVVGWAERGGGLASGHGNSVPRFHLTWGTGPGVLAPFLRRAKEFENQGLLAYAFRHRVEALDVTDKKVSGVSGKILCEDDGERGVASNREVEGDFYIQGDAVVITSGGIGGNQELVRRNWPRDRLGEPPEHMVCGVPAYVDGKMIGVAEAARASVINRDRMWHYTEGVKNHAPIWPQHGIRILPGPSSFWFDADGTRLPPPAMPGFDTLETLRILRESGSDYSWFILTKAIIKKEFALSGSEQNPDITNKDYRLLLQRLSKEPNAPVKAFMERGEDFLVADRLEELVVKMNQLSGEGRIDYAHLKSQIEARDNQLDNSFAKDAQITAMRGARNYLGDKLLRVAKPHRILDPEKGPLIAVRLHILTRKTLGGIHTDPNARVLAQGNDVLEGLYAAGEAAGFGGGGVHGYSALEGTFLGGCLFSGRVAGRSVLS
jgi:predicted oxidoreductase